MGEMRDADWLKRNLLRSDWLLLIVAIMTTHTRLVHRRANIRYHSVLLSRRKGEIHPALKVTDDGRGQVGHLQRELVPVFTCFPVLTVNLSILNHLT